MTRPPATTWDERRRRWQERLTDRREFTDGDLRVLADLVPIEILRRRPAPTPRVHTGGYDE